jgi:hypothetical protein
VLAGALISRGVRVRRLFAALAAIGIIAGAGIYHPASSRVAGLVLLCVWLAATGAATASVLAVLPMVVQSPQKGASAAGLISQTSALVTFVTPPIWLPIVANDRWELLIGLVIFGWLCSLVRASS